MGPVLKREHAQIEERQMLQESSGKVDMQQIAGLHIRNGRSSPNLLLIKGLLKKYSSNPRKCAVAFACVLTFFKTPLDINRTNVL